MSSPGWHFNTLQILSTTLSETGSLLLIALIAFVVIFSPSYIKSERKLYNRLAP